MTTREDLTLFATEAFPLRCSALPLLVACPWRAVQLHLKLIHDESGAAADTGTAVHKAVEAWHQNGHDTEAALKAMKEGLADYPLADLDSARLSFRPYTLDPRNVNACIVAVEKRVQFNLSPAADDPTQAPLVVRGTLDQVRRDPTDGSLALYDVKTGERVDGWSMMHNYALQIAAYCLGATELLGEPVRPGAIIRTRGYRVRGCRPETEPGGVFFEYAWGLEECNLLLDSVRYIVAGIRRGVVWPGPGDHCSYCPAKGLDGCLPPLAELRRKK